MTKGPCSRFVGALMTVASLANVTSAGAEEPTLIDRAVVRYSASELGGVRSPMFVFERELSFESRLQALGDPDFAPTADTPYRRSHLQNALERHIAESLLASLPIDPEPATAEMSRRTEEVRLALLQQVGGTQALETAQASEAIGNTEVTSLLRRRARASFYLDRMVAPMLAPSVAELQSVHRSGRTPFSRLPFPEVQSRLRRWYIGEALKQALVAFYEDASGRVQLEILTASGNR